MLHLGTPLPSAFLEAVAAVLGVEVDALQRFERRTVPELYVDGLCGGAIVPLSRTHSAPADVHVPLAHQSALAGVLLCAGFVTVLERGPQVGSTATRLDALCPVAPVPTAPLGKDPSRYVSVPGPGLHRRVPGEVSAGRQLIARGPFRVGAVPVSSDKLLLARTELAKLIGREIEIQYTLSARTTLEIPASIG